jgi:hypothetical protein
MRNEYSSSSSSSMPMQQQQHHHQQFLSGSVVDVTRVRSGDSTEPVAPHPPASKMMIHMTGGAGHNMIPYSPIRPTHSTLPPAATTPGATMTMTPSSSAATAEAAFISTPSLYNHNSSYSRTLPPALVTPSRPSLGGGGASSSTMTAPPAASSLPQRRTRSPDNHDSTSAAATTNTEGPWRTKELSGVFRPAPFSSSSSMMEAEDYDDDDDEDDHYPNLLSIGRSYAFDEGDAEC